MTLRVHPHTPRVAVPCRCELGEEATWDARSDTLTWVDVETPTIWRHHPASGTTRHFPQDEKLGFALLTEDPDTVLAGFESGVVLLHLESGRRTPLVTPDDHHAGNRLNSGHVGPDGALYFSTMDDAEAEPTGTFHRWHGGRLDAFGGRVAVSNGPVVTADGSRIYTADTAEGVIRVHSIAEDRIGPAQPFAVFEADWGKPDGLTVDAAGYLWVCHYGGSRITRFDPAGAIERVVPVPTELVTKCAFGGPDLTTLFVTTALRGRNPAADPMAGHLLAVETDIPGLPAAIYQDARTL
jgi:sugar lactone lactonase YvrE